jgi:tyrosine-specific transport protein
MGKLIGGILLVVGTSIGAGILALPAAVATSGFLTSSIVLFFIWALMTFNALLLLEVNLWLPENSNMISMARSTLGIWGQLVAWLSYLLLLYALLAAYISGGADVLHGLLHLVGVRHHMPWLYAVVFTGILGYVVYLGTRSIDYVNRLLMLFKLASFAILVGLVLDRVKLPHLQEGTPHYILASLMLMVTSFGFATILPSLRSYFHSDVKKLRIVVLVGSFIPLVCYILWDMAILGSLPVDGVHGLKHTYASGHVTSVLMIHIARFIHNSWVTDLSRIFTSICVATSFLGVAMSLSDFFADGLRTAKVGWGGALVYSCTFIPPLVLVIFTPGLFVHALGYAGTFCLILLALLPTLMVLRGRYSKHLNVAEGAYQVMGGKSALIVSLVVTVVLLIIGLYDEVLWIFH